MKYLLKNLYFPKHVIMAVKIINSCYIRHAIQIAITFDFTRIKCVSKEAYQYKKGLFDIYLTSPRIKLKSIIMLSSEKPKIKKKVFYETCSVFLIFTFILKLSKMIDRRCGNLFIKKKKMNKKKKKVLIIIFLTIMINK